MTNSMDSILEFQSKLAAELAQAINEPASRTLSAQEMIDLVKTIDSLHQYVKSVNEESQLTRQDSQLVRQDNELLKEKYKLVLQKLDSLQKTLQTIKSRDILNSVLLKQPELIKKHEKLRLAFVPGKKYQKNVTSPLLPLVDEANFLAHDFSVENVYASLNDPEISTAILEVLQTRLSENANLESLPQDDFMTLVAGVPKCLIQQALGRFLSFFFD